MAFTFDLDAQKQAAANAQAKGGGATKNLDLKEKVTRVLILPPTAKGAPIFFETNVHEVWANKKPIAKAASPAFVGEVDEVAQVGWKLRDKYKDHKSKKLQDLWKIFMPKRNRFANVLNMANLDAGPLYLKLPSLAYDLLLSELNDAESEDDMKAICDLEEGHYMAIQHDGNTGFDKRYTACKFGKNPVRLISQKLVDSDKIENSIPDLRKLQPAQDPAALKKVLKALMEQANYIIKKETGSDLEDGEGEDFEIEGESDESVDIDSVKKPASKKAPVVSEEEEFDLED